MTVDLKASRELHARTTPGKWRHNMFTEIMADKAYASPLCVGVDLNYEDGSFIVFAHEQWIGILEELGDSRRRISRRQEQIDALTYESHNLHAELESLRAEVARLKSQAGE